MKKRILSLLLILCMAVTLLPTAVFAEDATGVGLKNGQAQIGDEVYDSTRLYKPRRTTTPSILEKERIAPTQAQLFRTNISR